MCPPCRCAAVLLRLADFCGAGRSPLAKTGALLRVAVAQICSAGRRPLAYLDGCPCSASPVSAAGSGSATQPTTAPCFVHRTRSPPLPLLRLAASAAGSASAAQPTTRRCAPTACGCAPLLGGSEPQTALSAFTLHGVWDAINFAAWPWGLFFPTHPPTEVPPGLRPRPLTGALCLQLLPPGPRSVNLEGITPRPRQPFSSIGIVSVESSPQRKPRRST